MQNPGMRVLYRSRIIGTFLGYAPNTVHRLDDGTASRQVVDRVEHVYSERPEAWIYTDGSVCYPDVDGTSGVVQVARCVADPWPFPGPFDGRGGEG